MLEYYKRTALAVQLVVLVVSLMAYEQTGHRWSVAAVFFFVMQIAAVLGAAWAHRLRKKMLNGAIESGH